MDSQQVGDALHQRLSEHWEAVDSTRKDDNRVVQVVSLQGGRIGVGIAAMPDTRFGRLNSLCQVCKIYIYDISSFMSNHGRQVTRGNATKEGPRRVPLLDARRPKSHDAQDHATCAVEGSEAIL